MPVDITALKGMSREDQLAWADKYAGVAPGTMDGIWRTESARGTHATMIGPETEGGTAKGHFQFLDGTHASIEKKVGQPLDRFEFTEALVGAASLMQENRTRYKNDADATRAYFAGTNRKNWGPKTEDYVRKVNGTSGEPTASGEGALSTRPLAELMNLRGADMVAASGGRGKAKEQPTLLPRSIETLGTQVANIGKAAAAEVNAYDVAQENLRQATPSFGSLYSGEDSLVKAAYNRTMQPKFNYAMQTLSDVPDEVDPEFTAHMQTKGRAELAGFNDDEQDSLMEATNWGEFNNRKFQISEDRANSLVLSRTGTLGQFGAMFVGGSLDPMTWATGLGATKAFAMAGYGSVALAGAGRGTAALASVVAENVVANVAYEAVEQAVGAHKSYQDYAVAAATGLLPAALQMRGVSKAATLGLHNRMINGALERQLPFLKRAAKELGEGATGEDISALATKLETDNLRAEVAATRRPSAEGDRINAPDLDDATLKADDAADAGEAMAPNQSGDFPTIDYDFKSPTAHLDELELAGVQSAMEGRAELQSRQINQATLEKWGYGTRKEDILFSGPGVHIDVNSNPALRNSPTVKAIESLRQQFLPELSITFNHGLGTRTGADGEAALFGPKHGGITLRSLTDMTTLSHEFGHLIIHHRLRSATPEMAKMMLAEVNRWSKQLNTPGKGTMAARRRFGLTNARRADTVSGAALLEDPGSSLGQALREALPGEDGLAHINYLKSFDEYGAEQFVKYVESHITGEIKSGMSLPAQMVRTFQEMVKSLLELFREARRTGMIKPSEGFEQFFTSVLRKQVAEPLPAKAADGEVQAPAKATAVPSRPAVDPTDIEYGLDNMPAATPRERAEKKVIREIRKQAVVWDAANPTDQNKVTTMMNNSVFNLATPGAILASSDDPLARQIAGTIVEHAQGASGRRQTVAIRAHVLYREFVGNSIILYNQNYSVWRNNRVGRVRGATNDLFVGDYRDQFNRAVMTEQEARWNGSTLTTDPSIAAAADAMTVSSERMRVAQVDGKTPGWGNLPETSYGYMSHSISAQKYLATVASDPAVERAFKAVIVRQLMVVEKMDAAFADKVAGMYLGHARTNALGGGEIPANIRDPGAVDYIRQSMTAAGLTKAEVDAFANRLSAGAPSHTKKRLKLDLTEQFQDSKGNTVQLMDIFNTDPVDLVRRQSRKVAGEVALMGNGVAGSAGMEVLRRALEFRKASGVTPKTRLREMEAFDQIAAEILGRPFGDATPGWLDGGLTANAVANLGGMGITQVGEYANMTTGVGIDGTLKAMAAAPRLRAEIHALARGERVDNGVLSSMELPDGGGEFGLSSYKMVTLHDNPAAVYEGYGTSGVGYGTRLLRATSFALSSMSAHRLVHAVQTRGVAEQITLKAIRYIRDGGESIALKDMGFDAATVAALKADLPAMVQYGPNGGVARFDLRLATDKEAAAKFITAVHRGASQLIQDSYVGEKGKWQHSGVGKVLSQFRNFPLLAAEKQWGRQRGNRGAAVAGLMMLASAGVVLPLVYARVALNALGRPDREEYIEKMTTPYAIARAALNYVSMAGLLPDMMDLLSGTAQAVAPESTSAFTGTTRAGRQATLAGVVPVLGFGDELLAIPGAIGKGNPFAIAQTLPLSNLPLLVPFMNALRPE